jgi:hypothetical protein
VKPEAQRIAIAKACEWRLEGIWWAHSSHPNRTIECCPDYLNDLNAMHEAFRHLGRHWEIAQVGDGYVCRIEFGPKNKDVVVGGLELLPVMAEAFLRALGLWEESELESQHNVRPL